MTSTTTTFVFAGKASSRRKVSVARHVAAKSETVAANTATTTTPPCKICKGMVYVLVFRNEKCTKCTKPSDESESESASESASAESESSESESESVSVSESESASESASEESEESEESESESESKKDTTRQEEEEATIQCHYCDDKKIFRRGYMEACSACGDTAVDLECVTKSIGALTFKRRPADELKRDAV